MKGELEEVAFGEGLKIQHSTMQTIFDSELLYDSLREIIRILKPHDIIGRFVGDHGGYCVGRGE